MFKQSRVPFQLVIGLFIESVRIKQVEGLSFPRDVVKFR